jgi:choline dehydrogenase-like flavoprotein
MLVSALTIDDGGRLDCDLCIVGAGAAGLALAHEMAGTGLSVVVITGGGDKEKRASQSLYQGIVLDPRHHSWLHKYRVRRYGGTTNIWGGRCLPMDEIDLERRDYVPHSGWLFGYDELQRYYLRAANYCEVGVPFFDAAVALPDQPPTLVPGLSEDTIISSTIERFSRPTDFGKLLRRNLTASPGVKVLLDAHCIGLRGNPGGNAIESVSCATFKPSRFSVVARHYVLAAGGIESARLLLAARDAAEGRLAIGSPWLGRGYMCHLIGTVGTVRFNVPPESVQYDYHRSADGIYCRRRFWVAPEEQRRRGILNVIFRLHHVPVNDPSHDDPVLSAMYLVKDLVLYEYSRKMREERSWRQFVGHVSNIARHPVQLSRFAARWVRYRNLSSRQLPSVVLYSAASTYAIEYQSEQAPDMQSQIRLSDKRDAFGGPQAEVDWRCNDLDIESVRESYRVLRAALERDKVGTVEIDEARFDEHIRRDGAIGGHHIGTLRMAASPADGVTDANCAVFGVVNCSVASAAVMPTSGTANPTFTITALAIRLADHLKRQLTNRATQTAAA